MRLPRGERRLIIDERVTNLSRDPMHFTWGHHCVLGPPLVGEGAELRIPCRTVITGAEPWEDAFRADTGRRSSWPIWHSRNVRA